MRILAIAKPNAGYRWYSNLENVTIEARLVNNEIRYYEMENGTQKELTEKAVKNIFRPGYSRKDQPFLVERNRDFYAVLNRKLDEYHTEYLAVKNKLIKKT